MGVRGGMAGGTAVMTEPSQTLENMIHRAEDILDASAQRTYRRQLAATRRRVKGWADVCNDVYGSGGGGGGGSGRGGRSNNDPIRRLLDDVLSLGASGTGRGGRPGGQNAQAPPNPTGVGGSGATSSKRFATRTMRKMPDAMARESDEKTLPLMTRLAARVEERGANAGKEPHEGGGLARCASEQDALQFTRTRSDPNRRASAWARSDLPPVRPGTTSPTARTGGRRRSSRGSQSSVNEPSSAGVDTSDETDGSVWRTSDEDDDESSDEGSEGGYGGAATGGAGGGDIMSTPTVDTSASKDRQFYTAQQISKIPGRSPGHSSRSPRSPGGSPSSDVFNTANDGATDGASGGGSQAGARKRSARHPWDFDNMSPVKSSHGIDGDTANTSPVSLLAARRGKSHDGAPTLNVDTSDDKIDLAALMLSPRTAGDVRGLFRRKSQRKGPRSSGRKKSMKSSRRGSERGEGSDGVDGGSSPDKYHDGVAVHEQAYSILRAAEERRRDDVGGTFIRAQSMTDDDEGSEGSGREDLDRDHHDGMGPRVAQRGHLRTQSSGHARGEKGGDENAPGQGRGRPERSATDGLTGSPTVAAEHVPPLLPFPSLFASASGELGGEMIHDDDSGNASTRREDSGGGDGVEGVPRLNLRSFVSARTGEGGDSGSSNLSGSGSGGGSGDDGEFAVFDTPRLEEFVTPRMLGEDEFETPREDEEGGGTRSGCWGGRGRWGYCYYCYYYYN